MKKRKEYLEEEHLHLRRFLEESPGYHLFRKPSEKELLVDSIERTERRYRELDRVTEALERVGKVILKEKANL